MPLPQSLSSSNAPLAIGPYSQVIRWESFLFCSGQIAIDPKTQKLSGQTAEDQMKQILANIQALLTDCGSSLEKVVKTTLFLTNMSDFEACNTVYASFSSSWKPARSTVAVKELPKGALVEVEVIAIVEK